MVKIGEYLDFVKTLDIEEGYSTEFQIILELIKKVLQLENKIIKLEVKI